MDNWTFEDLRRLTAEASAAGDMKLLERIFYSDEFEPNLGAKNGLIQLIATTPEEKAEERKRVKALYAERASIKAKWNA